MVSSLKYLADEEWEMLRGLRFTFGGGFMLILLFGKLALYPNGDEKRNGSDHISLYLVMSEHDDIRPTSEVSVVFTFLVYDYLEDKYLTIQDGKIRRFHAIKTEWGFPQLLSLNTFNDASYGFLVNDCCAFGVDIFVLKCEAKGEVFSLIKEPKNNKYTWKIRNFSKLDNAYYESDLFTVEGYDWKIGLCPKGNPQLKDDSSSLFLLLDDSPGLPVGSKVYIEFEMIVKNQREPLLHKKRMYSSTFHHNCHIHLVFIMSFLATFLCADNGWLEFGRAKGWGSSSFMPLGDLMEPSKGFILDDLLIVTAKVSVISTLKSFS